MERLLNILILISRCCLVGVCDNAIGDASSLVSVSVQEISGAEKETNFKVYVYLAHYGLKL